VIKTTLLFNSSQAAQEVAYTLQAEWDGLNCIIIYKVDRAALETAIDLAQAEYCTEGKVCNIEITADKLLQLYANNMLDFQDLKLRNIDLSGADLEGINFKNADLRLTKFIGANLAGANLQRADLTGADLEAAELRGADLSQAQLKRVNLTGAKLARANLKKANLHKADLRGTDLSQCYLAGANLSDAYLGNTLMPDEKISPFFKKPINKYKKSVTQLWFWFWILILFWPILSWLLYDNETAIKTQQQAASVVNLRHP